MEYSHGEAVRTQPQGQCREKRERENSGSVEQRVNTETVTVANKQIVTE